MSYQALGRPTIVVNTAEAAFDLLEKRSANYSDRPPTPMIDLCVLRCSLENQSERSLRFVSINWNWNLAMQRYCQPWRWHRRLFWQHFHPGVLSTYEDAQNRESIRFLQRLLDNPSQFELHSHQ